MNKSLKNEENRPLAVLIQYDESEEIADSDFVRIVISHSVRSQTWYVFYITPRMRYAEIKVVRSKQDAERYAQRVVDAYNARAQRKQEQKQMEEQERKNFSNPYKVGDLLYSSWGYDQTNIDFYKVLAVSGKSIKIVQVADKIVGTSGQDDLVVPTDKAIGVPMVRRVSTNGYVRINSYAAASFYAGKPMRQTNPQFGH